MHTTPLKIGLMFMLAAASCAQKLPKEVTNNRPVGAGEIIDLDAINLVVLETNETVNLGSYMKEHNLSHMLITFGSRSCVACMEKTAYLEKNLVGQYQLLGPRGNSFELRGVNVDPRSNRQLVLDLVHQNNLSHLSWSDPEPKNSVMMKYFQPAGAEFGVPLSVMIDRKSILWRVSSKDQVSSADLIRKVAATLGEGDVIAPDPEPTPKPVVIEPLTILAEERPDRLSALPYIRLSDGSVQSAHDKLESADLKFVIADRGSCGADSVCQKNLAAVTAATASFSGKTSDVLVLGGEATAEIALLNPAIHKGGDEIYKTFSDHFNWNYKAQRDPKTEIRYIPEVLGPVLLVFDQAGKLVFSREGEVSSADLQARWMSDLFSERAPGPNYPLHDINGLTTFSQVRKASDWTIVLFWDTMCDSCLEELGQWHKPNDLLAYCAADPMFCQVVTVDEANEWYDDNVASIPSYMYGVLHGSDNFDGFDAKGWNVPLYVDPTPKNGPESEYRWFNGWVSPRMKKTLNRSILYDREGKIWGTWEAAPGEHGTFEAVKALKK